jgi:glycine/D-amino acid oxidase-like deaminating enzyme
MIRDEIEIDANSRSGTFDCPIIDERTGRCQGVITKDGTKHLADRVVMATGAWTPSLVNLENQCVSKVSPLEPSVGWFGTWVKSQV